MDYTRTTSRTRLTPQGNVNLDDLRKSVSQTRSNFTRVRAGVRRLGNNTTKPDFITFVSLACEIYQAQDSDYVPVAQYPSVLETFQGKGHTSLVTQTEVALEAPSNFARGTVGSYQDRIIIKRPRNSILQEKADGLISFITELRVRSHANLKAHPNIARLRGIGWDFEDEDATIPRPILLEELAPQGALDNFWRNWSFVRLGFKAKLDFCRDVADGLQALHANGVVHGDVKPENILVFPRKDARESFMLKLTDFGHSVIEADRSQGLPAFTQKWSAPEAATKASMTFSEMKATDYYSYGLVLLSIMLVRPFYEDVVDLERSKQDGSILGKLVELLEKEDRYSDDSDLEVGTIVLLLSKSAQLCPSARSLDACISIIETYQAENQVTSTRPSVVQSTSAAPVSPLDVISKVTVGYRTLLSCSYHLKAHIARELEGIASKQTDPRQAAAAWELVICYFSGFGVARDYDAAGRWLDVARGHGIVAAQDFFEPLQGAIAKGKELGERDEARFSERHMAYANLKNESKEQGGLDKGKDLASKQSSSQTPTDKPLAPEAQPSKVAPTDQNETTKPTTDSTFVGPSSTAFERYLSQSGQTRGVSIPMSEDVRKAITRGEVERLRDLLMEYPDAVNSVDQDGNTPLLLAADKKQLTVLQYLLSHPDATAGVHNNAGQTALHLIADFDESDEQVINLAPQLVAKGADLLHEALPVQKSQDRFVFSLGLRCCPMLNAVLHDKLLLLKSLLVAAHPSSSSQNSLCQICEAGSRFRRILAVSLSLFRIDALELLTAHLQSQGRYKTIELANIRVWAGQNLLPLYKVPFQSVAISAMDLPESFFRAMIYGTAYTDVQERTIDFLLAVEATSTHTRDQNTRYSNMLRAACAGGSLDGINHILERMAEKQTGPIMLYQVITSVQLAIQYGLRDIFGRLLAEDQKSLEAECQVPCGKIDCSDHVGSWRRGARLLMGRPRYRFLPEGHSHEQCFGDELLHPAISVRHQDSYFTSTIVEACTSPKSLSIPNELFRALHSSNFKAADILLKRQPDALVEDFNPASEYLLVRDFHTVGDYNGSSSYRQLSWKTVATHMLSIGSYVQCRYVLSHLLSQRSKSDGCGFPTRSKMQRCKDIAAGRRSPNFAVAPMDAEDNIPAWQRCPLTLEEYDALLTGNIMRNTTERQVLWSVIDAQIKNGHPRSTRYLMMAVDATNIQAIDALLDRGWSVNGTWRNYLHMPLQRTTRRWNEVRVSGRKPDHRHLLALTELHGVEGPPALAGPDLQTHSDIYEEYHKSRESYAYILYNTKMSAAATLLSERGARVSPFAGAFVDISRFKGYTTKRDTIIAWVLILHTLVYAAILPLAIVFGTDRYGTWEEGMTRGQKFGFVYLWALLSYLMPHWGLFSLADEFISTGAQVLWLLLCLATFIFNHVGLPYLVIAHGWRPFQSCEYFVDNGALGKTCTNLSFLLPMAVGGVEAIGAVVAFVILDL